MVVSSSLLFYFSFVVAVLLLLLLLRMLFLRLLRQRLQEGHEMTPPWFHNRPGIVLDQSKEPPQPQPQRFHPMCSTSSSWMSSSSRNSCIPVFRILVFLFQISCCCCILIFGVVFDTTVHGFQTTMTTATTTILIRRSTKLTPTSTSSGSSIRLRYCRSSFLLLQLQQDPRMESLSSTTTTTTTSSSSLSSIAAENDTEQMLMRRDCPSQPPVTEDDDIVMSNYSMIGVNNMTLTFGTSTGTSSTGTSATATTVNDLLEMAPGDYVSTEPITVLGHKSNDHDNAPEQYSFRVHLYPFGRRRGPSQQSNQGFGMSYAIQENAPFKQLLQSANHNKDADKFNNCRVVLYIEFLPQTTEQRIDASFTLRLLGGGIGGSNSSSHNTKNELYALEWKSGMRFVHVQYCQLEQLGQANDFGTPMMRSYLLPSFFSTSASSSNNDDDDKQIDDVEPIRVQLDLQLHDQRRSESNRSKAKARTISKTNNGSRRFAQLASSLFQLRDIRLQKQSNIDDDNDDDENNHNENRTATFTIPQNRQSQQQQQQQQQPDQDQEQHDTEQVRTGRIVVPICTQLSQRAKMFQLGIYPGVEYRIMRIHQQVQQQQQHLASSSLSPTEELVSSESTASSSSSSSSIDVFYSRPGALYDLKPVYPLVKQLERSWPVTVNERDIPKLCTPFQYNVISAIGSLLTAVTSLSVAFILSQCISLYYIPSKSMAPTLQVGDVLLVEKISPKINHRYRPNDVVLFNPPTPLQDVVRRSGGTIDRRSLFVKRVAGIAGDSVTVYPTTGIVRIVAPSSSSDIDGTTSITIRTDGQRRDLCDTEPIGLIKTFLPSTTEVTIVPSDAVEVLGDCSSVSIDSRVWGVLPIDNIVGRPIVRLWPISKFGRIPSIPIELDKE